MHEFEVGDLIEGIKKEVGIIVAPYDVPKKLWVVFWLSEGVEGMCHERNIKIINKS